MDVALVAQLGLRAPAVAPGGPVAEVSVQHHTPPLSQLQPVWHVSVRGCAADAGAGTGLGS